MSTIYIGDYTAHSEIEKEDSDFKYMGEQIEKPKGEWEKWSRIWNMDMSISSDSPPVCKGENEKSLLKTKIEQFF